MDKEYIEREKARELIDNYGKNAVDLGRWSLDPVDDIIALAKGVDKIPSSDVVEVVRCKNCAYSYWEKQTPRTEAFICGNHNGLYGEIDFNDFCSYGVRKED